MFYARHKIVSPDPEHGVLTRQPRRLWNAQVEMSDVTGNTCRSDRRGEQRGHEEGDRLVRRSIGLPIPHRLLGTRGTRLRRQVRH